MGDQCFSVCVGQRPAIGGGQHILKRTSKASSERLHLLTDEVLLVVLSVDIGNEKSSLCAKYSKRIGSPLRYCGFERMASETR
ncbi:MAG: hypothetical protein JWQ42_2355 [Edaphobacter sp.]|nr:hypothetical protein [Edaphobacter sp.]